MGQRLEVTLSVIIGIAAVSTAAVAIHREFFSSPPIARQVDEKPTYLPTWKKLIPAGQLIGAANAAVTIVEFADVECPFCRMFKASFDTLKAELGDSVALVFVHYPIPSHRFAIPGARALDCSATEGRFGPLVSLFFEKQDSLGLKSWLSFAHDAGVRDTSGFQKCIARPGPLKTAESGLSLGKELGVHGTPTFFINGWRFSSAIRAATLRQVVRDIRAGKDPSVVQAGQ